MDTKYVFFIKDIVDYFLPDEEHSVDTPAVVEFTKKQLRKLTDEEFIQVMISCFIPDLYKENGKCEKLFTKLSELMLGEWWYRMGGVYNLPTQKSGTEDVELIYTKSNISVVCDSKVFRLGRSQKAPNVKDFLKLASVITWMEHLDEKYNRQGANQNIIGGFVTYSSLHEWKRDSEVYQECTNTETPVVMLPYEVLAVLLSNKKRFSLASFFDLWNYSKRKVITSTSKEEYWTSVDAFMSALLNMNLAQYRKCVENYRQQILMTVDLYIAIIEDDIKITTSAFVEIIKNEKNIDVLKKYAIEELTKRDCARQNGYLENTEKFRRSF